MGPILEGVKVVELGRGIPAAHCARLLGDFGAEVIKVEPPEGDPTRWHGPWPGDEPHRETSGLFLGLNVNKLGITLNVATATGREILLGLVREADVFVTDLPRTEMDGLGLTYDVLNARNSRLVMTSITVFGLTGPYRDYTGDHLVAAAAGTAAVGVGEPGREPLNMPLSIGGYQSGACGSTATIVALFARQRTGAGQLIDISESDVWATLYAMGFITTYVYRGVTGIRRGRHGSFLYPDSLLPCKDGYIGLVCNQLQQWIRFLELAGTPEWTQNPRYRDRRKMSEEYPHEVDALLAPWLKQYTKAELFAMCREKRIPMAPCHNVQELLEHEQLAQREAFVDVEHPVAGKARYPGPPYRLSATPARIRCAAPTLGQHNREILGQRLGYQGGELARLRMAGVI